MPPKKVVPKRASSSGKSPSAKATAKSKAGAKAGAKGDAASSSAAAGPEEDDRIEGLLDELFSLYDADQDGQIERVELLEAEEKRIGQLDYGPKERKATIAWFKEAGAEGTPTAGMFITKEKWKAAFMKLVTEGAGGAEQKPSDWLQEHYGKLWPKVEFAPASGSGGEDGQMGALTPPEYPMTVSFRDFLDKAKEAARFKKRALVLTGGRNEVETFMNYRSYVHLDAKMYVSRVFGLKNMTLEDAIADAKGKLTLAMNSHGFCKPLHIRMSNAAVDWSRFCGDDFPTDVFDADLWTIDNAHKRGFFDDGHRVMLESQDAEKWREFDVVLTSTFDLESAQEYLADKIPHFDKLAILVIDPSTWDNARDM